MKKIFHPKHSHKAGGLTAVFAVAAKFLLAAKVAGLETIEHGLSTVIENVLPEATVTPLQLSIAVALIVGSAAWFVGYRAHRTVANMLHR